MNSQSVDLIATDPPFNKGRDFHATPDSLAAGAKFQDRWSWEIDVHQDWVDQLTDDHPHLMEAIESARYAHSDGMGAYICFMAVRLLEMKRVLKPTGSIYLHCDPTASHYLKAVMDAIFGWRNFRNEVVWSYRRYTAKSKRFQREHDVILFYGKRESIFNVIHRPYGEQSGKRDSHYKQDEDGRWFRWQKLRGKEPYKIYLSDRGRRLGDVWQIPHINASAKERTGYPTQKPLALYERFLEASSKPGDIVLDPFAGCATTLVAAERLQRQWVGIDIWDEAHDAVIRRLVQERLMPPDGDRKDGDLFPVGQVHYTREVPERTDGGDVAAEAFETPERRNIPKEPWQRMSRQVMFAALAEAQSITPGLCLCAGCGRELEAPFMELDHIVPRAGQGTNDISNRILLCRPCNGRKNANLTLPGLRRENGKVGWMLDERRAVHAHKLAQACHEELRYGR